MIVTGALCWCGCGFRQARKSPDLRTRFWAKVARGGPDECWEWLGARHPDGYGKIGVTDHDGRRVEIASRMAYQLVIGPIPEGLLVLHTCDNPPCCNPAHLFAGTRSDNTRDMVAKGRHRLVNGPETRRKISEANTRRYASAT